MQGSLYGYVDLATGFSYGMQGTWNTTDCVTATQNIKIKSSYFAGQIYNIFVTGGSILAPFYAINDFLIALSNVNVACVATTQATQFNNRLSA